MCVYTEDAMLRLSTTVLGHMYCKIINPGFLVDEATIKIWPSHKILPRVSGSKNMDVDGCRKGLMCQWPYSHKPVDE